MTKKGWFRLAAAGVICAICAIVAKKSEDSSMREEVLDYLREKYGKEFIILSRIKKQFLGDGVAYAFGVTPANNQELRFITTVHEDGSICDGYIDRVVNAGIEKAGLDTLIRVNIDAEGCIESTTKKVMEIIHAVNDAVKNEGIDVWIVDDIAFNLAACVGGKMVDTDGNPLSIKFDLRTREPEVEYIVRKFCMDRLYYLELSMRGELRFVLEADDFPDDEETEPDT